MSKRTILLLVFFIVFLWSQASAFAAVVSIPDTNADAGETIKVPVNVDDAAGIAGFQFTVTYDSSVIQATGAAAGDLTTFWIIIPNIAVAGQISVTGITPTLTGLPSGNGSLAALKFKVVGNSGDNTALDFTFTKLSGNKGAEVPVTSSISGKIIISVKD